METGLMSDVVADAIEAVESAGGTASMAMLGEVIFAIGGHDALCGFGHIHTCKICHEGARLL